MAATEAPTTATSSYFTTAATTGIIIIITTGISNIVISLDAINTDRRTKKILETVELQITLKYY